MRGAINNFCISTIRNQSNFDFIFPIYNATALKKKSYNIFETPRKPHGYCAGRDNVPLLSLSQQDQKLWHNFPFSNNSPNNSIEKFKRFNRKFIIKTMHT